MPRVTLQNDTGQPVTVTGNKLDVNATSTVTDLTTGNAKVQIFGLNDNLTQKQIKVNGDGETVGLDIVHYKIHDGTHFDTCIYDSDVDTASPKYVLIRVPLAAALPAHLSCEYESSASGGLWEIYKAPTTTNDGASVPVLNSNDTINPVGNNTLVFQDPTVTAAGTFLSAYFQGTAGGTGRTGGSSGSRNERILKPGADYLVKFTPTADNTTAILRLYWYECICA